MAVVPSPPDSGSSAPAWVDLEPGMQLRVEGAYYRDGSPRMSSADYMGMQTVTYAVRPDGALQQAKVDSFLASKPGMRQPRDQAPVQLLINSPTLRKRRHRLFFPVVMNRAGATRPAVLLGARSGAEMERITAEYLKTGAGVCQSPPARCSALPAWCTASVEIEIVVNGVARKAGWGATVGSVVGRSSQVEVLRMKNGRITTLPDNRTQPEAVRRLALMHGDLVNFR